MSDEDDEPEVRDPAKGWFDHYEELRAELAARYAWTFDTIDGMPLDQILSAINDGKSPKFAIKFSSGEDVERYQNAMRQMRPWRG